MKKILVLTALFLVIATALLATDSLLVNLSGLQTEGKFSLTAKVSWDVYRLDDWVQGKPFWEKQPSISQYTFTVQCAEDKDFAQSVKSQTVSGEKEAVFSGLGIGKEYFFKVSVAGNGVEDVSGWYAGLAGKEYCKASVASKHEFFAQPVGFIRLIQDFYANGGFVGLVLMILAAVGIVLAITSFIRFNGKLAAPYEDGTSYGGKFITVLKRAIQMGNVVAKNKKYNCFMNEMKSFLTDYDIARKYGDSLWEEDHEAQRMKRVALWCELGGEKRLKGLLECCEQGDHADSMSMAVVKDIVSQYYGTFEHPSSSRKMNEIIHESIGRASSRLRGISGHRFKDLFGIDFFWSIGGLAPMLGLFGTVLGISKAFFEIAMNSNMASQELITQLAGGINEALYTTIGGLFVGIPMVLFYYYFNNKLLAYENAWLDSILELMKHRQ